jgi:hypothetical protein
VDGVALERRIGEDDMIAVFLAAEIDSRRFRDTLLRAANEVGLTRAEIRDRGTGSEATNRRRREVLARYRGWGEYESVFGGLPTGSITWWTGRLLDEALPRVEAIAYLLEMAPTLRTRKVVELHADGTDAAEERDIRAVAAAMRRGGRVVEPILIGEPSLERLVILEGHTRIAGHLRVPAADRVALPVIVGVTPEASEWSEW